MKKFHIIAIFGLVLGLSFVFAAQVEATDNVNFISVTSCEQVGNDIRISRNNGPKYILTSSCRDAGHGMRQYKMNCVSGKQYKVEWTTPSSCTNQTGDTTNPSVSLITNKSTVNDNETVILTANASDNRGVTKIEIREGNTIRKTCLNTNNCTYPFTADASQNSDRTQTFSAKAYDAAGNVKTSNSLTITTRAIEDTTRPTVEISTSKSNIKTGQQVTISTSAKDSEGIAKIEIYQNGERVRRCNNSLTCYYTATLRLPSNSNSQTHSFYMKATDINGNYRNSNTVEVRVTR